MSAAELMLVCGVMLLAQEMAPGARVIIGASAGLWGIIIMSVQYFL